KIFKKKKDFKNKTLRTKNKLTKNYPEKRTLVFSALFSSALFTLQNVKKTLLKIDLIRARWFIEFLHHFD
ncbi:hypothetical protein BpHYR1_046133, partial [Brachionus plicatilis]